ncbi:hypothetical protein GCM10009733_032740 [Nonomuraea maheshkhaliensis]|uniref:S1 RNA-binding domain-containing protein n=1 Tax=Nonomuraea maheshkhaliensis TaxID=419590 RepID=A0ABP4R486_9ACTN
MDEYVWPHIGPEAAEKIQEAWPVTCQMLPVGKRITATVIGRQPFGIFVRMHGVPDAVGLAEVVGMPRDFELPQLGAQVEGHVADHVERNHQVRITLDGWVPPWNDSSASRL